LSEEDWRAAYDNLFQSVVECMRLMLPNMKSQQWGRILMLTSSAAREPIDGLTLSNSFRAGLLGLMKSASNECARDGITVNSILPGYIRTDRLRELGVAEDVLIKKIPAGRLGTPEELADVAAFLVSERAKYVTGQAIAVDGGVLRSI
jgi:3-oxoacyl-[acyl-carrier protein] reductase